MYAYDDGHILVHGDHDDVVLEHRVEEHVREALEHDVASSGISGCSGRPSDIEAARPTVSLNAAMMRAASHWKPWERYAMALAACFTPAWRTLTVLVEPATVLRWHRIGLRWLLRVRL